MMRKIKHIKTLSVLLTALISFSFSFALVKPANIYSGVDSVYDSYDDYDTDYDRQGRAGGIYQQIILWGSSTGTHIAESGNPVGTTMGKSLRLKQTSNAQFIAWGKGMKDPDKLNQTGAKYVKLYIRNLSCEAREMGIIVTDILQSTIDSFANAGNTTPDYGQEHWMIAWNQPVLLETLDGQKSVVKAVNGSQVLIPKDFEGSISVPLESKYWTRPGWWLQEGHTYGNAQIDLDKIFMVSVMFPELTDIISPEDPDTWTVFEVDNAIFGSDNSVIDYINENGGSEESEAKNVVKPINNNVTVDFKELTITAKKGVTKDQFINCFDSNAFDSVVIKDSYGFVVANGSQELQENYTVEFVQGIKKFTFTLKLQSSKAPKTTGCGSVINIFNNPGSFIALMFPMFLAFLSLARKEKKEQVA